MHAMLAMTANEHLLELAPCNLPVLRHLRYDGGGFGVPMAEFAPEDQAILRTLYEGVQGFHTAWRARRNDPDQSFLDARLRDLGADAFLAAAQRLGDATVARGARNLIRKVVHDVRGGGLTVLIGTAKMVRMGYRDVNGVKTCASLARDHAKIMRNALTDIDTPVRDAEEAANPHGIGHFIDKWTDTHIQVEDRAVHVSLRCDFTGNISARCLETSAIDRILYNYINNAARFSADGEVVMTIVPVGDELVRWVVSNAVTAKQRHWLGLKVGADLRPLFRGGVTNGGHGIGLSNCADFLAASFGLRAPQEAVERGYLGAKVIEDQYHAWFHWPVLLPSAS